MSTLTTINSGDAISDSRAVINTNFSTLNTDKIETSVIDTDTSLAANSDAKIPSQKAVKAYVDAGGAANASTIGKGIVEEATQAEVDAGTAEGGTGARLYVNPSTIRRYAVTLIPQPNTGTSGGAPTELTLNSNTTMHLGQIVVPLTITVNKLSLRVGTVNTPGTIDVSIYSEDGQTRHISVTSGTLSSASVETIAVSAVTLYPGVYYVALNSNGTTDASVYVWETNGIPFSTTAGLGGDVSSEPVIVGTYTISAGTPPSTITLSSITENSNRIGIVRLDN